MHEDVKAYAAHNIQGIIEDGSQRSFFPNGFAFYCYARTMFDTSLTYNSLLEDYFTVAYGEKWCEFYAYFKKLSETINFGLLEQETLSITLFPDFTILRRQTNCTIFGRSPLKDSGLSVKIITIPTVLPPFRYDFWKCMPNTVNFLQMP